jgi:uncharacterized protein (TIGR03382 family)
MISRIEGAAVAAPGEKRGAMPVPVPMPVAMAVAAAMVRRR